MFRRLKRALLAAWWAARNADRLTRLRHDLALHAQEVNTRGAWATWYLHYLRDLPIR